MFAEAINALFRLILNKRGYRITFGIALVVIPLLLLGFAYWFDVKPTLILERAFSFAPIVLPVVLGIAIALVEPSEYGKRAKQVVRDEKEILRNKSSELADVFHVFRLRMLVDSDRLKFNSNKNLAIGILFSFFALSLLAYFVVFQPSQVGISYVDFALQWYAPRISIVLLLQFVGFFFLRLYVASELDVKHNKNEITNIEAQMMAYAMAREFGADGVKPVIEALSRTERNFIVKKDEKTIAIENPSEYNDLRGFVDKLLDKIPAKSA